jgi:DnaD/phage-associated family protein
LSDYDDEDIADATMWEGKPAVIIDALIETKFIDEDETGRRIHDWHEYAGRLIDQRKTQAVYKQKQYALYNDLRLTRAVKSRDGDICQYCGKTVNWSDRRSGDGGTYDHIDPDGENAINNIVVCCRSCNSKKGGRTPEQAKMPLISGNTLENGSMKAKHGNNTADIRQTQVKNGQEKSAITVPNLTVPNLTVPEGTKETTAAAATRARPREGDFAEICDAYQQKLGSVLASETVTQIETSLEAGMTPETVILAADKAVEAGAPTGAYVKAILRDWRKKGIKTLADVERKDKRPETARSGPRRGGGSRASPGNDDRGGNIFLDMAIEEGLIDDT